MVESTTVPVNDIGLFKLKALSWANHFNTCCLLDGNDYPVSTYPARNWVLAVDALDEMQAGENAFELLKSFHAACDREIFGFFGYDLKNQLENLQSLNPDRLKFPDLYFFKPRFIIEIIESRVTINRNYPETFAIIEAIQKTDVADLNNESPDNLSIQLESRTARDEYLENVTAIKQQIGRGDFYELNYCTEFYATGVTINPVEIFMRLNKKGKAPFSCYFKLYDKYLLCASPERFLKKEGDKLISQPIKGTIKKGETAAENEPLKQQLQNDPKERAENIMIVDLVRNDLSKSSKVGSVQVEELCAVYEFNTVNQMISTVASQIVEGVHFIDAIKNAFPMGSMTGAPKIEVMKSIDLHENFRRSLYSGAVGYISQEGDFDFNVVIRSILYNSGEKYLSLPAGGAITFDSKAENEFDEILLKARSMMEVLRASVIPYGAT
jgi:para-aminobenzoate synthetase component 1